MEESGERRLGQKEDLAILEEANVVGVLLEAAATDVQPVLADDADA